MNLSIHDHPSVGLSGRLVCSLCRQDRGGTDRASDKTPSIQHELILPEVCRSGIHSVTPPGHPCIADVVFDHLVGAGEQQLLSELVPNVTVALSERTLRIIFALSLQRVPFRAG